MRLPWELFGVHLGWSLFVCAHPGCSNGDSKNAKKCFKIMVWETFEASVLGDPSGLSSPRKRSHAAWRSFCVSPDRSHAAWRPFSVSPGRSHAAWRSFFAMSPLTFRYVTSVFLLFYKDFAMLPSIFKGKPMISLCYLRF